MRPKTPMTKCEFKDCDVPSLAKQDFCSQHIQEPCFWNKEVVNRSVTVVCDDSEILGKQLDAILLALFIGSI